MNFVGSNIKQRDYTWDVMKFVLIVLVILGHWLLNNLKDNSVNRIVYNFRGLFTMPLFVFISGYFTRKKEKAEFVKQVLHLLETYMVMTLLYEAPLWFFSHKPFTWKIFYAPDYSSWFLLSLILWRGLLQVVPELWLKSKFIIPICIVVSLAAGFIPFNLELSLQRTLAFLPFFVCGYFFKKRIEFDSTYKVKSLCMSVILVAFIGCCIFCDLDRDNYTIIWCSRSYYFSDGVSWKLLLLRIVFLFIATIMVFCILRVFPKSRSSSFLDRLGADTMYYYVYHVLVIRVGMVVIRHFCLPLTLPLMLLYTLFTVVLIFFLVKISFFRKLLNPISSFMQIIQ